MIEPEMAWCDLDGCVELAEAYVKHLIRAAFERCCEDMICQPAGKFDLRPRWASLVPAPRRTIRMMVQGFGGGEAPDLSRRGSKTHRRLRQGNLWFP